MSIVSKQVFYAGRVQGVGFRYSAKQIVKGFDVTGWVRNLPDGRVELQASGEESEVIALLKALRESHLNSHITNETETTLAEPVSMRGFVIRHD
ncbi:MAG: acylphosphatase [Verrucomicrobiota bacterium]|nr:acylphosphatase [Verrucomicrobiota bacterium]